MLNNNPEINKDGTKIWYNEKGQYHRIEGPAVEIINGDKFWYQNGNRHRLDGPAIEYADGDKSWWLNGKLHRIDGPAYEGINGDKEWHQNGERHRVDGPAIDYADGDKEWWIEGKKYTEEEFNKKISEMKTTNPEIDEYGNKFWYNEKGELHRLDGPAVEWRNGNKEWYKNGQRHRLDSPAIEDANGYKYWFIEGEEYTKEEFNKKFGKKEKTTIKDIMKDRFEKAAYRSASRQMVNGISKAIVLAAEKKGMDSFTTAAVGNFFETELGEALIGAILGVGIPYIPKINKDKRALKLAEEFQIESISTVTDTVLDEVLTYVLPVMKEVLNNLPAHVEEENEEEESVVSYSSSTAKA